MSTDANYVPTPKEIEESAAQIRSEWGEEELYQRSTSVPGNWEVPVVRDAEQRIDAAISE